MNKDLGDLQCELRGVSMILAGLSNQLDSDATDSLRPESLSSALYGVRSLIERVAEDMEALESEMLKKK